MTITEIVIAVGDVDEAVTFYQDVCGFSHVRTVVEGAHTVAELRAGSQRVTLVVARAPGVHLVVPTEDAGRAARRLRRHEVAIAEDAPVAAPGGLWVAFRDPWGNQLGFWQDHDGESGDR